MNPALALVTALWLASLATQAQPTPSPASEPMMKCHPGVFTTRDGQTYVTQMVPMATNSDHWIASVLSYIRNSFGNEAPFITAKDVARVRAATLNRKTPPTHEEVKAFGKTSP